MRLVLWLMGLFAVAVASALLAGSNRAMVTLFWHPHRLDVSLNLFLLALVVLFGVLHLALRAFATLVKLPVQAQRWRDSQRERALTAAVLDAVAHWLAGRFVRARKAAELAVSLEESVRHSYNHSGQKLDYAPQLRALSHLIAAQSAHALQDHPRRESHLEKALIHANDTVLEGIQLRRASWALDDQDAHAALQWLNQLSKGVARRTVALRMRFQAARLKGNYQTALESARLLVKHRAYSAAAGQSIVCSLAVKLIQSTHDTQQLERVWKALDTSEKVLPDVACEAAERCLQLHGDIATTRPWLQAVWGDFPHLSLPQRIRLVRIMEHDAYWLPAIEKAQQTSPNDAVLHYLAGMVCVRLELWGKGQQMLQQSLRMKPPLELSRSAWLALARIAEKRQDTAGALAAYKNAAESD